MAAAIRKDEDTIFVKHLLVRGVVGVDNWERQKPQDIIINLKIYHDTSQCAITDHVDDTVNYSEVTKVVVEFVEVSHYKSVEGLAEGIAQTCLVKFSLSAITVRVEKPRALLHAASAGVEITRANNSQLFLPLAELRSDDKGVIHSEDQVFIKDLLVRVVVGVNLPERDEKQNILVNLSMWSSGRASSDSDTVLRAYNYRTICRMVTDLLEQSSYKTIEALAGAVAKLLVTQCHIRRVTVRIDKPSALLFANAAGVEITRDQSHYGGPPLNRFVQPAQPRTSTQSSSSSARLVPHVTPQHLVYIALGSNLGDRAENITNALRLLPETCRCKVVDTSFLYATPPEYYLDQPEFLNAICKVFTDVSPTDLLKGLKTIEANLGRVPSVPNGPRLIDLDILFYDDVEVNTDDLIIPHARLHEREFVLRPLRDIAARHEHPKLQKTVEQLWRHLKNRPKIHKVLPIGNGNLWQWEEKTYIMGILNVTPDSFSDGGKFFSTDSAVRHAKEMIAQGASIIDVGGLSTKPNAEDVSASEEIDRVVPVIKQLRSEGITTPISIDTWRAEVAEAALQAGANFINDVTGGTRDPSMYSVMAKYAVPVCLMHMRGDSKTMMASENKEYPDDDVVIGVRQELATRVHHALQAGVFRWNIIIDPGLGFAKHPHQSIQLLRSLSQVVASGQDLEGFPTLVGPSRKGFIGSVINKSPEERVWGTAAACSALIAEGVDILRVHDVSEMVDVIKFSDAIWRGSKS